MRTISPSASPRVRRKTTFLVAGGILATIAASAFVAIGISVEYIELNYGFIPAYGTGTELVRYYNAYASELVIMGFLCFVAGAFGLMAGIMALRRQFFKLTIGAICIALFLGVASLIIQISNSNFHYWMLVSVSSDLPTSLVFQILTSQSPTLSIMMQVLATQSLVLSIMSAIFIAVSRKGFSKRVLDARISRAGTDFQKEEPSSSESCRLQGLSETNKYRGYLEKLKKEHEQGEVSEEVYSRLKNEYLTKLRELEEKEY